MMLIRHFIKQNVAKDGDAGQQADAQSAQSAPTKQNDGAQDDDLETLLAEFDSQANAEPDNSGKNVIQQAQQAQIDPKHIETLVSYVGSKMQEEQDQEFKKSVDKSVNTVLENLPEDKRISPVLAEGFLHKKASSDPRFAKAFQERDKNPKMWNSMLKAASKDLLKELSVDRKVTNNVAAAAAAVRSSSSNQPNSPLNVASMSDSEFEDYKAGLG